MNLDRVARRHVHLAGRPRGAFSVVGWSGFWLAVVLVLGLSAARGLSVGLQAAIAVLAAGVYVAMAAVARRVLGRAVLIYYHHILAFLACTAALTALLGGPVLAHLDVTAAGLAVFTAVARVGCLMVGCCHGRPAAWGIAYGPEHAEKEIPGYLVRVRLLPVPGFEAIACAALCIAASAAVARGAPDGTAFAIFVGGYAVVRFGLEWLRGDLLRPYARRLSEAQWTSLALAVGVAAGAAAGVLPHGVAAAAPAAILLAAAGVTITGRAPGHDALLAAPHVAELAGRLERLAPSHPDRVVTARTSRGLRLSRGGVDGLVHYTVSADRRLSAPDAEHVGRAVAWLRHPRADVELIPGPAGALHVVAVEAPRESVDPGSGPDVHQVRGS